MKKKADLIYLSLDIGGQRTKNAEKHCCTDDQLYESIIFILPDHAIILLIYFSNKTLGEFYDKTERSR